MSNKDVDMSRFEAWAQQFEFGFGEALNYVSADVPRDKLEKRYRSAARWRDQTGFNVGHEMGAVWFPAIAEQARRSDEEFFKRGIGRGDPDLSNHPTDAELDAYRARIAAEQQGARA